MQNKPKFPKQCLTRSAAKNSIQLFLAPFKPCITYEREKRIEEMDIGRDT